MKVPEIRINFSDLLTYGESQFLAEGEELLSYEDYEKQTKAYREEWKKYEKKIVSALQYALDVTFYKSVIDVECAPYFVPKSFPLIMNFRHEPNQFIDVLMHELCHVLLTDNNKLSIHNHYKKTPFRLLDRWAEFYGKQWDFNVLAHIPVHALSKHIYLDVLKDENRLKRDQESVKGWVGSQAYLDSWNYVEKHDYKKIIAELKQMYAKVNT